MPKSQTSNHGLGISFRRFSTLGWCRRVVCTPQFPQFRFSNVIERPDPTVGRVRGWQTWGRGPSRRARQTPAVVIRHCATHTLLSWVIRTRSIGWKSTGESRALCDWGKFLQVHDVGTVSTGWIVCGGRMLRSTRTHVFGCLRLYVVLKLARQLRADA